MVCQMQRFWVNIYEVNESRFFLIENYLSSLVDWLPLVSLLKNLAFKQN